MLSPQCSLINPAVLFILSGIAGLFKSRRFKINLTIQTDAFAMESRLVSKIQLLSLKKTSFSKDG